MKKAKPKYYSPIAGSLAVAYLTMRDLKSNVFLVKILKMKKIKGYSDCRWAFFFQNGKKVWDCNVDFFKAHFYQVKRNGKSIKEN